MTTKTNVSWWAIFAVFLVGCCATSLVPQTVPILGKLAAEFGVERSALGWVISLPSLACAIGALAFGIVIDRLGDRTVLFAGVLVVIAGDLAVTQADSLRMILAARVVQGLGYIALTVAGATFVLRTTTGEHRKKAMALWAAHTPAGFAAAILLVTPLAQPDGNWRWAFGGHAIIVAVIGFGAWLIVRNIAGSAFSRAAGIRLVLTNARAYRVGLASLGSALLQTGLMTVLVSHLGGAFGTTPKEGALFILAAMTANLAGAIVVVVKPMQKTQSLLIAAAVAALAGSIVMQTPGNSLQATVAALIIFAGFLGTANALIWSSLPGVLPNPQASGAFGGFVTQTTFIGVLLGPPIFFALSHAKNAVYTIGVILVLFALMTLAAPAFLKPPKAAD